MIFIKLKTTQPSLLRTDNDYRTFIPLLRELCEQEYRVSFKHEMRQIGVSEWQITCEGHIDRDKFYSISAKHREFHIENNQQILLMKVPNTNP